MVSSRDGTATVIEPALRFALLGPFAATRNDISLDLGHPKQRAVLALLVINANTALMPDEMIDALWGHRPPPTATATLQAYVSNIRRVLEPDRPARAPATLLTTTGAGYKLVIEPMGIDAHRFASLVSESRSIVEEDPVRARRLLSEALDLWAGPPLSEFRYAEFAQQEIARLDEVRLNARELRVEADLQLGATSEVTGELEALIREYPMRESLRAQHMLALYRAGRQAESLASYQTFADVLRDELGLDPGNPLRELQLAILQHDPCLHPPPRHAVTASGERGTSTQIVGRQTEAQRFTDALEHAGTGTGSVLLIEGEAGIGKTRLLELFHQHARSAGATSAFARCVEIGGTPPFWPWAQLIRQLNPATVMSAAGDYAGHLAPLMPLPPNSDGGLKEIAPHYRVAEGLVAALQTLAEHGPVVLLLDDLYSSDPDSLSVLALLAAELDRLPVVIIGTHRGHDLGPGHPLTLALAQLARFDWVERIPLNRFDLEEVGTLMQMLTNAVVDPALVSAIHERTDGNAFFTIELTKLIASQDRLEPTTAMSEVPGSIRDVVARRLDQLSDETVRLLRFAAVAGRHFDLSTVAEVVSLGGDVAAMAIDEAIGAGLLVETERPGTYRFAHIIVVDAVIHSLGSVRRAQIHALLADSIERTVQDSPDAWVDVAHHRVQAIAVAGPIGAVDALANAGRRAMEAAALALAERLFEQRLELISDLPSTAVRDSLEVAALIDLARVLTWSEGYHSRRLGDAAKRAWDMTGLRRGTATLDTARAVAADDPVLSALQARFSYEIVRGNIDDAHQIVDRYLELADHYPDPMVTFGANVAAMIAGVHAGAVDNAVRAAEVAASALEMLDPVGVDIVMLPLGQQSARVTHHCFAGWAYYLAGQTDRAQIELRTARSYCDRLGHGFTTGFCVAVEGLVGAMDGSPDWVADTVAWGRAELDDGVFGLMDVWHDLLGSWARGMVDDDPAAAAKRVRGHLQTLESQGALAVHSLYWAMVAGLEQRTGRHDRVVAAARKGIEHANSFGERFWYPELERLAAVALAELGQSEDSSAARRRAATAARELRIRPLMDRLSVSMPTG